MPLLNQNTYEEASTASVELSQRTRTSLLPTNTAHPEATTSSSELGGKADDNDLDLVEKGYEYEEDGTESRGRLGHGDVRPASEMEICPDSPPSRQNAHACSVELVEHLLDTSIAVGLSTQEALTRLAKYGPNKLAETKPKTFLMRLWGQFNEILTWILLATVIISGALESWAEFALILAVIVINVSIGLIQEGKATKATQALKNMLSTKATVFREGKRMEIDATEVVPGDVVFLESGNKVPADIRLFQVESIAVQEAMLTGESLPSRKKIDAVPPETPIGDRDCMCYSATLVVKGQGKGICVATGDTTEIGRIAELVSEVRDVRSPLLRQIDAFGRWIGIIVIPTAIVTFLIAYLTPIDLTSETSTTGGSDQRAKQAVVIAVAVAVSIIPAGLQAIITICMAVAVKHMAEKNAIVKTLPSVEILGNVMVICSDKTGTLTKNEMTGVAIRTSSHLYRASGVGYNSSGGRISRDPPAVDSTKDCALEGLLRGCVLNNESRLESSPVPSTSGSHLAKVIAVGDPTECALLCLVEKQEAVKTVVVKENFPRIGVIPFESEHKFMATFHPQGRTECLAVVKGAPDRLLIKCSTEMMADGSETEINRDLWFRQVTELSSQGYRCLALCQVNLSTSQMQDAVALGPKWLVEARKPFLTFLGVVAILDPPREECIQAIQHGHKAGIVVKMITGDHPATALAIGKTLGLVDATHSMVLTGAELDAMTLEQLSEVVEDCNIFARASPDNKITIVRALQNRKKVCSMTGDGVNDAPALRAADVGVAMGITGSDVSKDAAKIVLADDNFATILVAVQQGRRVWDNLRKIVVFNMPANFAQAGIIFFAVCLQWSVIPLTAIQVLYVNMITCCTLGLVLAIEPAEHDTMMRPPRRLNKGFIGRFFFWRVFFVATIFILAVLGSVAWIRDLNPVLYDASAQRAIAFNCLVFCQVAYVLNCRYLHLASFHPRIFRGNPLAWICVIAIIILNFGITYIPGLNTFFSMSAMDGVQWGIVFLFTAASFFLIELEKQLAPSLRPYTGPLIQGFANAWSYLFGMCTPACLSRFWTPEAQHAAKLEPSNPTDRAGGSLRKVSMRRILGRITSKKKVRG